MQVSASGYLANRPDNADELQLCIERRCPPPNEKVVSSVSYRKRKFMRGGFRK